MKEQIFTIIENKKVGKDVFLLTLKGDTTCLRGSGQFANLKLRDYYLRRPLSIFDYTENTVTFLYKVLGKGTDSLSRYEIGEEISILIPLGNGFDTSISNKPLLIGGGIGIAPLYHLGKEFKEKGIDVTYLFGFKNKDEIMMIDAYKKLGNVIITTDDGSYGFKGNPVSYLKENKIDFDKYFACGPSIMLKYLCLENTNGEVSLEARMGCGFGACMGCSIKTTDGYKRVCKEGPVFKASEVIYE